MTAFPEIMLDIETLGTKPGSIVVTIGAVAFSFDHDEPGPEFLINISVTDSHKHGLTVDPNTVLWWMRQSPEAQAAMTSKNALCIADALERFRVWCVSVRTTCPKGKIGVWGNDNTFDIVLMESVFDKVNKAYPWAYWESRSVRTLVSLGKTLLNFDPRTDMERQGVHHSAVDDCKHQIRYCKHIYSGLNERAQLHNECKPAH